MSQDHFSRLHLLLQEFETELARASGSAYGELQGKVSALHRVRELLTQVSARNQEFATLRNYTTGNEESAMVKFTVFIPSDRIPAELRGNLSRRLLSLADVFPGKEGVS